jgi:coenzyme F420 hydrogenase subunit beta
MCIGCGACAYICPQKNVHLVNIPDDGIRPVIRPDDCVSCSDCLNVCPGHELRQEIKLPPDNPFSSATEGFGPVLEIWEGYASHPGLRYHGSSGGLVSAIALYCMEKEGMHGTLHIGADPENPLLNRTVMSRGLADLLDRTGSRYSPASPCDELGQAETAPSPCVFVGKPCDVAGARKARSLRPELEKKIGIAIGFFCAGTPSTQGLLDLLNNARVDPARVAHVSYRGKGWPGAFFVRLDGENASEYTTSYMSSWGFLQKYRPYRCHLCPDGTGEFADISCGDPWYREAGEGEPGRSLVLVRTERGRTILKGAIEGGYVRLAPADLGKLVASQINLLEKRRSVWGRLLAFKLLRIPTPRFEGFSLFRNWLRLSAVNKARSVAGTARRCVTRRYFSRLDFSGVLTGDRPSREARE